VQYYPVGSARWKLDYTHDGEVGLEVYVLPRPGQKLKPQIFLISLKAAGTGTARHWLVDSWVPSPTVTAPTEAPSVALLRRASGGEVKPEASIGAIWLAVPFALVGGVLLAVALVVVRNRRRNARVEREYAASLEQGRGS